MLGNPADASLKCSAGYTIRLAVARTAAIHLYPSSKAVHCGACYVPSCCPCQYLGIGVGRFHGDTPIRYGMSRLRESNLQPLARLSIQSNPLDAQKQETILPHHYEVRRCALQFLASCIVQSVAYHFSL